MKREWLIYLLFSVFMFAGVSCGDDDDKLPDYDVEWKEENDAKIAEIAKDPEFTKLPDLSGQGNLYYKVLETGDGNEPLIKYGEKVYCNYEGSLIDGTVFDSQNNEGEILVGFNVQLGTNGIIGGWCTALQYMREGDKWEVWLPQELAYGKTGDRAGVIPPYSALHFIIEVVKVERSK